MLELVGDSLPHPVNLFSQQLTPAIKRVYLTEPYREEQEAVVQLIFVYNAEHCLFNALTDAMHQVFSPATYDCRPHYFTYKVVGLVRRWKHFLEALDCPLAFYHRPEFWQQYQRRDIALPASLAETDGTLSLLVAADQIKTCQSLDDLIGMLRAALDQLGYPTCAQ